MATTWQKLPQGSQSCSELVGVSARRKMSVFPPIQSERFYEWKEPPPYVLQPINAEDLLGGSWKPWRSLTWRKCISQQNTPHDHIIIHFARKDFFISETFRAADGDVLETVDHFITFITICRMNSAEIFTEKIYKSTSCHQSKSKWLDRNVTRLVAILWSASLSKDKKETRM